MRLNEREDILDLTREWTGERFPNGRPRVSDEKIEIIKTLTQEEIWHPLYFSGYRFQFQGGLQDPAPRQKALRPGGHLLLRAPAAGRAKELLWLRGGQTLEGRLQPVGH